MRYLKFFIPLILLISGCKNDQPETLLPDRSLSAEFKNYWFGGEAEITSYKLEQTRYGENRSGTAVLIFVTEDFLPEVQVKANEQKSSNIPVLKLNATKNFVTGIYPYSIMQSVFYPLEGTMHALKASASIQEWCGQVYIQLNNKNDFEIVSHSYFEGEADEELTLEKTYLENEVWTQLRINPQLLPTGNITMIPSLEYIRLAHIDIKAYEAFAEFYQDENFAVYQISYPGLTRKLRIFHQNAFPHKIVKWEEITQIEGDEFITTATRMEDIKTDYWNKNSNNNLHLRDQLNLK